MPYSTRGKGFYNPFKKIAKMFVIFSFSTFISLQFNGLSATPPSPTINYCGRLMCFSLSDQNGAVDALSSLSDQTELSSFTSEYNKSKNEYKEEWLFEDGRISLIGHFVTAAHQNCAQENIALVTKSAIGYAGMACLIIDERNKIAVVIDIKVFDFNKNSSNFGNRLVALAILRPKSLSPNSLNLGFDVTPIVQVSN